MAVPGVVLGPGRALDAYSIRARWAPVFLVVLPPLILCFSLVPGLPAWNKLWPLLSAAGVVVLVELLAVRDVPKVDQRHLLQPEEPVQPGHVVHVGVRLQVAEDRFAAEVVLVVDVGVRTNTGDARPKPAQRAPRSGRS